MEMDVCLFINFYFCVTLSISIKVVLFSARLALHYQITPTFKLKTYHIKIDMKFDAKRDAKSKSTMISKCLVFAINVLVMV